MGTGGWCLHRFPLCLAELMQCFISADYRWGKDIHETWIRRNEILWFCSDLLGFREEARNSSEKYEFEVKTRSVSPSAGRCLTKLLLEVNPFVNGSWALLGSGCEFLVITQQPALQNATWLMPASEISRTTLESPRGSRASWKGLKVQTNHTQISLSIWRLTVVLSTFPIAVLLLLPSKPNSLVEFFSCP